MSNHIIQNLIHQIKCNKCGKRYDADNIDSIRHKGNTWFLSIYCPICQKQTCVIAIVRESEQIKIATDLNNEELLKFANTGKITIDYLLDLHNFLKDFSGDFISLFEINNIKTKEH